MTNVLLENKSGATAQGGARTGAAADAPQSAIYDALASLQRSCRSKEDLYRQSLRLLATHFDAPYAALRIERTGQTFADQVVANEDAASAWSKTAEGLMLTARYQRTAKAKLFEAPGVDGALAAMGTPLSEGDEGTVGSLFVATVCGGSEHAAALLRELQAAAALIGMAASLVQKASSVPAPAGAGGGDVGLLKAAQFQSLHEMAFALCHNLKNKLACDQTALGLVRGNRVDVLCISGFDDLYPRSPGARVIRQAMAECLDARRWVSFPGSSGAEGADPFRHRLHEKWHDDAGHAAVASIPLCLGDEVVGILSLRNPDGRSFAGEQLVRIAELVAPFVPGLQLMEKASRSAAGHLRQAVSETCRNVVCKGGWGRRALLSTVALGALWLALGNCPYIVSAPCVLQPSDVRQITVPFEATLAAALVKPGDEVHKGDLLVRLDTRPLEAEREKLQAEAAIARLEGTQAAATKNLPLAAQADAMRRIAEAQLHVVEHRIAQSQICAPSDGLILSGDLSPMVGEVKPMGELLLEFAPRDAWRVEVHIPEHAVPYVLEKQTGQFAFAARPDDRLPIRVTRIKPSSEIAGGRNVFTVEAELAEPLPSWVRGGMEGAAQIDTGPHRVWWVYLHRTLDQIRMALWKL